MKLYPVEHKRANKMPMSAQVFQVIGISQLIGTALIVLSMYSAANSYGGSVTNNIQMVSVAVIGISVSAMSFALARIVADLNAIRWHTACFDVWREENDDRLLRDSIDELARQIAIMSGHDVPAAPRPAETERDPFDAED